MWGAAQRFIRQGYREQRIIIHLGDHDPSGIDMTRDIQERLNMFGADVYVKRVALTMNQIDQYNPPPNPAKLSDSRCHAYMEQFGDAKVCGDAKVFSASHVLVIGAIGSRNDFTTFYRDKDGEITVKCGCFLGKIDKFLEKVTATHGNSKYALVYRAAVEVAKLQIDLSGEAPEKEEREDESNE